ncbi:MAG: gliding motility-associated C-terminal domain-containing protein [Edaphocola sp.]
MLIKPLDGSFNSYSWSTGSTASSLVVDTSGTYILSTVDECGLQSDTIDVDVKQKPNALPPIDTTLCVGDSLDIRSIYSGQVHWFDQMGDSISFAEKPYFNADEPGIYPFLVSQVVQGCESDKSNLKISVIEPPTLSLPDYVAFCPGDTAIVAVQSNTATTYIWNNGVTGVALHPTAGGQYSLTAANVCGAVADSIFVLFDKCEDCLWMPKAFSPNGDGVNDYFEVRAICDMLKFKLFIYNMLCGCVCGGEGQKVFETYSEDGKWDGSGHPTGVYFYRVAYINKFQKKSIFRNGEITLMR